MIENLKILGNRLLVLPMEAETMIGSFYLPQKAIKRPYRGTVVAVGLGRYDYKKDSVVPMSANVGDVVMYTKGEHQVIEYQGKQHVIISNSNIIAKRNDVHRDLDIKSLFKTPFASGDGCYMFGWEAVRDVVFIWPDVSEDRIGSFILPEISKEQKEFGTVLSAGKGYYDKHNKFHPSFVKTGDRVLYDIGTPWTDDFINARGEYSTVRMMGYQDINALIEEEI